MVWLNWYLVLTAQDHRIYHDGQPQRRLRSDTGIKLVFSNLYILAPLFTEAGPASPFACAFASCISTFFSGRYRASHICSLINSSSSDSSCGMSFSSFNPSFTAACITALAICTLISRTSVTSGSRPALGSLSAGACAARAFVAATTSGGDTWRVLLRIAPRPIPGNVVLLLHSAGPIVSD